MSELLHDSHIIRTWHDIAVDALNHRATDIHIEARSQETIIRTRIDGLLTIQNQYPIDFHERLITRIKVLARLDIAEKRLPQDGRLVIGYDFSHPNIDCRVSILPTLHGEKAVVRILPSRLEELALNQIGLLPEQLEMVQEAIGQTNGLILVTGPTGSGKTRTLYSCLSSLNQVQRNICSVEDPIEIRLPGINQVAYHPKSGLDFPTIIRALLRQDPDVIMIGEIRDSATAQLAIQAAQTGHLVLSTLHTRNAIGALSRLKSLGVDQESIESCLRCVSSQRLIRKRCNQCNPILSKENCKLCKGSGYFGRIGVHEVLGSKQLFESAQALDIYSAGLHLLNSGLIDQISLDAELGSWH
ncbi:MAG: GspE/PulE family protein [Rhodoferax sp.]|nr:GspE/PulE family protein [Rhodoferax sp.]MCF8190656.1 GspE/PulE family protein [Polynucleobacter sp.]